MDNSRIEELARKKMAHELGQALAEQGEKIFRASLPEKLREIYPDMPPLEEFQVINRIIHKEQDKDAEGYIRRTIRLVEIFKATNGWVDAPPDLDEAINAFKKTAGELPESAMAFGASRRIVAGASYDIETGDLVRVLNLHEKFETAARLEDQYRKHPDYKPLPGLPSMMVPASMPTEQTEGLARKIVEQYEEKLKEIEGDDLDSNNKADGPDEELPPWGASWEPPTRDF